MGSILAIIQKKCKKRNCFILSAVGFVGVLIIAGMVSGGLLGDFNNGFCVFLIFCYTIFGILFLAAGICGPDRDESAAAKPPRFYTVNEEGDIVLTEVSAPPPLDCTEIRRADGKIDVSMELHSKERAAEVLAALAVMYDKGDITDADYRCSVRKIREHFNL